jgi:Brp/Blh family beta-carotene 15,15'-monooxygenase
MNNFASRATIFIALSAILLLVMRALESQWPPIALWAFVLLSLTFGFGHGALDAVLLLEQFRPRLKALVVSAVYLLCVILAGWVFSWSVPWALMLLLLMSVWHFGELYGYSVWTRLSVGGASVMWPMLVAQNAMFQLLQSMLGSGFEVVWRLWSALAYGWFILMLFGSLYWLASRLFQLNQPASSTTVVLTSIYQDKTAWAVVEIVALLCAYLVLSPLLAFAMYFGLYHSLAHIDRVRRAVLAHSGLVFARYALAFVASVFVTAVLLVLLWWFLPVMQLTGMTENTQLQFNQLIPWLVVSLAAVTLPHLLLVSYSARWLGREHQGG